MIIKNPPKLLMILLSAAAAVVLLAAVIVGVGTKKEDPPPPAEPAASNQDPLTLLFPDLKRNEYDSNQFRFQNGYLSYGDGQSVLGVDVSSHQEKIDWQRVRSAGVEFAVIRAAYRGYTSGGLNMDPLFADNLKGAKEAGIQVGVYLFSQAVSVEEAREEAEFLLDCLDGAKLDLPVFYDWEYVEGDSRTRYISGPEITEFAIEFCSTVERAGYDAGVYFNVSLGYTGLNLSKVRDYDFWLAQYEHAPDFLFDFGFWQYSDAGSVPGIEGNVDLNLMFISAE